MTFCPEWLTGSPNLDTSNVLYLWVYLVVSVLLPVPLIIADTRIYFCLVHERHVSASTVRPAVAEVD